MSFIRVLDRLLVRIESAFLVLFLATMILLAFLQVILRNVFGGGLVWGDPIVRHLVLWVGFVGAAVATSDDRHISIDALTKFIPARITFAVHVVTNLFALTVCAFLASAAYNFLIDEKGSGSTFAFDVPTWIGILIIPVGYGVMALHFLIRAFDNAARAISGIIGEGK